MVCVAVHRESIEAPCPALAGLKRDRESSKCKEMIPFYCSSLANPVAPLKRDLRFATTSYGECTRCSIFKHGTQVQTWYVSEICLGLARAESEPANLASAREQTALALSA